MGSIPTAGIQVTTKGGRQLTENLGNTFGVALGSHLGPAKVLLAERDPRSNRTEHNRPVDDQRPRVTANHRCVCRPVLRFSGVPNGQFVFSHHPQTNMTAGRCFHSGLLVKSATSGRTHRAPALWFYSSPGCGWRALISRALSQERKVSRVETRPPEDSPLLHILPIRDADSARAGASVRVTRKPHLVPAPLRIFVRRVYARGASQREDCHQAV